MQPINGYLSRAFFIGVVVVAQLVGCNLNKSLEPTLPATKVVFEASADLNLLDTRMQVAQDKFHEHYELYQNNPLILLGEAVDGEAYLAYLGYSKTVISSAIVELESGRQELYLLILVGAYEPQRNRFFLYKTHADLHDVSYADYAAGVPADRLVDFEEHLRIATIETDAIGFGVISPAQLTCKSDTFRLNDFSGYCENIQALPPSTTLFSSLDAFNQAVKGAWDRARTTIAFSEIVAAKDYLANLHTAQDWINQPDIPGIDPITIAPQGEPVLVYVSVGH